MSMTRHEYTEQKGDIDIDLPISPVCCTLSDLVESAHSTHFLSVNTIRRTRGSSRVRGYSGLIPNLCGCMSHHMIKY